MAVNREQFDAPIQRLEGFARQQPALYKLRVGLLAMLGYLYLFSILAGLVAVLTGLVLLAIRSGRISTAAIKFGFSILVPTVIAVFIATEGL